MFNVPSVSSKLAMKSGAFAGKQLHMHRNRIFTCALE